MGGWNTWRFVDWNASIWTSLLIVLCGLEYYNVVHNTIGTNPMLGIWPYLCVPELDSGIYSSWWTNNKIIVIGKSPLEWEEKIGDGARGEFPTAAIAQWVCSCAKSYPAWRRSMKQSPWASSIGIFMWASAPAKCGEMSDITSSMPLRARAIAQFQGKSFLAHLHLPGLVSS